ncbi:hypothetical protein D3C73_1506820 [compost metagenome]
MSACQFFGLFKAKRRLEYLLSGVQLDASAFRNGLNDSTVHGSAALAVFGHDIQKTTVTEQQFGDLILKGL